jgi:spermidine synthase
VLAEIDEDVVEVCKEFFPGHTSGLSDPRVDIQIGDGFDYLEKHPDEFDAVLSDSTDPVGPGVVLFSAKYFELAKSAMKKGGCFVTQVEGIWSRRNATVSVRNELLNHFSTCEWYGAPIPTYPGGYWSFLVASDRVNFRKISDPHRQQSIEKTAKYYSAEMHSGLFSMPQFIRQTS